MKGLPILSAVKIYDSAVRRSQLFASMEPTFAHQVKDLQSRQQPDKDKYCYKYKHKDKQRQKQHKNSLSDPSLIIGVHLESLGSSDFESWGDILVLVMYAVII